MYLQEQHTK